MWNYHNLGPSVSVLFVIFMFYVTRPRLPLRSRFSFVGIVFVEVLTMVSDYVATKFDENYVVHSETALYAVNIIYFMLFFLRIVVFYVLTLNMMGKSIKDTPMLSGVLFIIHLTMQGVAISSYWTGALFEITDQGYKAGVYYNLLYVYAYFFLAVSLMMLFYKKGRATERQRIIVTVFIIMITGAYVIRAVYPKYLVMDLFYVLSLLIVYLEFENPEFYLNSKTGLFHYDSLLMLLDEWNGATQYKILAFSIRGYRKNREVYGAMQMDKCLFAISKFLKKEFHGKYHFYLRDGRFAILLKKDSYEDMIAAIRKQFEKPWKIENTEVFLDAVFALYDSKLNEKSTTIIEALTESLEESVAQNGEVVVVNRKTLDKISRLSAVKVALEMALDDYSVVVNLQPVFKTEDFSLVGAESLVRINDAVIGRVKPEEFIPIAEMNGSIVRLGNQVFEKTCEFYGRMGEKLGLEWINVNVSPIQFKNKKLRSSFESILNKYGITPDKIRLEITEQNMVDAEMIEEAMNDFIQHGFRFSLDDYGSGYSNAVSLLHYPLSNIKIDRNIVKTHFEKPSDFLPGELKILKGMDVTITAEGVETEEMAVKLKEYGCDYLQGYYFEKPISMEEFEDKYQKV
ncbi:MAG: EAL domain-containing protein [Eubacterium sp.]|nr:EAL domain-containing protein [Eubacterium sp.]